MAHGDGNDLTWKEQKRRLKLERKQDKQLQKRARKQEKLAAKLGRRQQREGIAYRALLDRAEASALVDELVSGLKAGKVHVAHGDSELTIEPPENLDVRVRARQTWKSQALTIRLRWPRAAATGDSASLRVSAK